MSVKFNDLVSSLSVLVLLLSFFFTLSLSNPDFTTLLAFKHSADTSHSLSSWSNSSSFDHCSWTGVTCDPFTRRVLKLVLNHLNLSGSIQTLTGLPHLRHLSLHHNRLSSGADNLSSFPNLKHLYLSHNHFAGKFPSGISRLRHLHRLDLSHNYFSGEIPLSDLANLPQLLTIRLEFNSFTGSLNSGNSISTSISDFNVSGNYLIGRIPNYLSRFPISSFAENRDLCGKPLASDCSEQAFRSNQTIRSDPVGTMIPLGEGKKKSLSNRSVMAIITLDVGAVLITIGIVACCCYYRPRWCYRERKAKCDDEEKEKKKKKREKGGNGFVEEREGDEEMVYFEGCKGFVKVEDLLKASAEMLGKGSVGTTYKAVMEGGDVVVVKRVRDERVRRKKEVDWFLREIGGFRHTNIVSLRAYYSSKDELLLVYDFHPNGSLHSILHGNRGPGRTPLDWTTRLKLAMGSAKGLAFLHCQCKSKLYHGHITSSNIIIDNSGNACITDIGLHHFLPFPLPSPFTIPYKAPELLPPSTGANGATTTTHRKTSQKSDVYSFGVVLLEILTGKMASTGGERGLAKWVQRVSKEEWTWEVFDFELLRFKEMGEEMVDLLQVALLCLADSPRDRPTMAKVCGMIEDIRGGKGQGHAPTHTLVNNNNISSDSSSPSPSETTPNFTSN